MMESKRNVNPADELLSLLDNPKENSREIVESVERLVAMYGDARSEEDINPVLMALADAFGRYEEKNPNPENSIKKINQWEKDLRKILDAQYISDSLSKSYPKEWFLEQFSALRLARLSEACEGYKEELGKRMVDIFNDQLADGKKVQHHRALGEILTNHSYARGLCDLNAEFKDAYDKYRVVADLQSITENQEITANKKFQEMDKCLSENKKLLCHFPDNALIRFLSCFAGTKVGDALIAAVQYVRNKLSTSSGERFFSTIQVDKTPGGDLKDAPKGIQNR